MTEIAGVPDQGFMKNHWFPLTKRGTVDGSFEIRRAPVEFGSDYPIIYKVLAPYRRWCRISSINSIKSLFLRGFYVAGGAPVEHP